MQMIQVDFCSNLVHSSGWITSGLPIRKVLIDKLNAVCSSILINLTINVYGTAQVKLVDKNTIQTKVALIVLLVY